jgi:hypothetical protein
MAWNLHEADLLTAVYNRTAAKTEPFVEAGVEAAPTPAVLASVRPALDAMGDPVVDCGAVGDGTRTKLFVNLLLGTLLQGYAEALVFGKKQGLSFEFMQEILEDTPMHADLLDYKGAVLANRDFTKQFPVDLLRKDLDLILEAAEEQGAYLPQTAATREAVNGTSALGHGDDDMMAVIKLLEKVAGVTVGRTRRRTAARENRFGSSRCGPGAPNLARGRRYSVATSTAIPHLDLLRPWPTFPTGSTCSPTSSGASATTTAPCGPSGALPPASSS